eukprot:13809601-Alexandrium_andersonii.AAC.1
MVAIALPLGKQGRNAIASTSGNTPSCMARLFGARSKPKPSSAQANVPRCARTITKSREPACVP